MTTMKRIIIVLLYGVVLTTCISCKSFDDTMDFLLNGLSKEHDNVYKYPHLIRAFSPSARLYFDTGTDDKNEIDVFEDGKLSPAITLAEIYFPYGRWKNWHKLDPNSVTNPLSDKEEKKISYFNQFLFGPTFGIGITVPPEDAERGVKINNGDEISEPASSNAPVLFLNAGFLLLFPLDNSNNPSTLGFEFGLTRGYSTDDSIDNKDDSAIYAGLVFNIPFGQNNNNRRSPDKQ